MKSTNCVASIRRQFLCTFAVALAPLTAGAAPCVATDIAPVYSLVARVMEGAATPTLIFPSGASPHDHALRPSEAAALAKADLVVWVGPDLAPQFGRALRSLAGDADVLELLDIDGTNLIHARAGASFAEHDHDHGSEEDEEGAIDPHAWLDPENAIVWVGVIAEKLVNLDPDNAALYHANAQGAQQDITETMATIQRDLAPLQGRTFFVQHDATHYFEARFRVEAAGAIAASDDSAPGPARLRAVRDAISDMGVVCVLTEPGPQAERLAGLLDGTAARTGVVDPLGSKLPADAALYPALLLAMSAAFQDCL